jgi:hypothetical protein
LTTGGYIDEDKVCVISVLIVVSACHDNDDGLAVGRDLRIRDANKPPEIVELHAARLLSQSDGGKKGGQD